MLPITGMCSQKCQSPSLVAFWAKSLGWSVGATRRLSATTQTLHSKLGVFERFCTSAVRCIADALDSTLCLTSETTSSRSPRGPNTCPNGARLTGPTTSVNNDAPSSHVIPFARAHVGRSCYAPSRCWGHSARPLHKWSGT